MRSLLNQRKSEESGIALVELLVAITVLVGILTATALSLMQGLSIQNQNNQFNQAVQLAQIELDKAKSMTFDRVGFNPSDITGGMLTYTSPDGQTWTVPVEGTFAVVEAGDSPLKPVQTVSRALTEGNEVNQEYTVLTEITADETYYTPGDSCPPMKKVTVQVMWRETDGTIRNTGLSYDKTPSVQNCRPANVPHIPL